MISLFVYIGIGALAGVFAGLLGVGGGLVVVPLLSIYFRSIGFSSQIFMHLAIGSSLASMIITTFFSTWAHYRKGAIDIFLLKLMGGGIIVGSVLGAVIAGYMESAYLSYAMGILALVIAVQLFFNIEWKESKREPSNLVTRIGALIIGTIASLLGIGAGAMGIPFLLAYRKVSIYQAIGVAAALSLIVSSVGTLIFYLTGMFETTAAKWATGYIYWPAVLGINIGSPLVSWGCAHFAHLLPVIVLKRIFAAFLFTVGARMLFF